MELREPASWGQLAPGVRTAGKQQMPSCHPAWGHHILPLPSSLPHSLPRKAVQLPQRAPPCRAPLRGELAVDAGAGGHAAQAGTLQVSLKLCQVLRLLAEINLLQHAGADVAHNSCRQATERVARWGLSWVKGSVLHGMGASAQLRWGSQPARCNSACWVHRRPT